MGVLKPGRTDHSGTVKTIDEYTPAETASHIRDVCLEQRENFQYRRPVDRVALTKCAELVKKIDDKALADLVASTTAFVQTNEPPAVRT